MNFLTYGDRTKPAIFFVHGMASTALLCYEPILQYLKNYYVILAEVDGHEQGLPELENLSGNCCEIENYILKNLNGHVFCLSGFSMGGTMAVEIVGRGNVTIDFLHLDAAFLTHMGLLTKPYEAIFCWAISRILAGKKIPKVLMDSVMGKDNNSVVEMLYPAITAKTIINVCEFVYKYNISGNIRNYKGKALFWYGKNEPYPAKSYRLLKQHLPNMAVEEFPGMGHGQYLHEHSAEYAQKLLKYIEA